MSKVVQIRPTRRVTITAHQVAMDLVPRTAIEELFNAAIAVGWAADDEAYNARDDESAERLAALIVAVNKASQYTVTVERELDEPI